ncbi:hypothetical protein BKA67DRAFT_102996 [Truncatella angustata]|uniref:Transfer RNA methyltransferase 82 n=1 Tax=Truncatella angustata TaxID=152316 RepID=A0A9P8RID2_9PEZI|nr:uncharacterized protein BKA67DRAFT_102996 [Truncatella angustata]KAH6646422.1 hypothetical protein BKA67DRAFT_102996 [Truncatella angustata]
MHLPYQCVAALGQSGIVAAARGTSIFTFGADGSVLSSWEHPATQHQATAADNATENGADGAVKADQGETSSPTKRRKIETEAGVQAVTADTQEGKVSAEGDAKGSDQIKAKKGRRSTKPSDYKGQEQPHVIMLRATQEGSHLIAVTGTDKAIWVFQHDGQGQLKELSQRSMPKRPCDLTVTSDNNTILVADKFGDVYSLPLIPSASSEGTETPKAPRPLEAKGPNSFTVHTQRNLKALIDQEHQRQHNPQPKTKEVPTFVHELLIGHVSMLTSVTVASAEGKPYIITADRDEHIRVSRGIPQSYVIENFCLGHTAFVNALCLAREDILVSGGGDNELYVWDWRSGVLQGKADLLNHVRQVVPDASKVAVTQLVSSGDGFVFAICER